MHAGIDFSNGNVKLTKENKKERFPAMKRVISLLLMLVLLLSLPVASFAAQNVTAVRSNQALNVDGRFVDCGKYAINGNNYFRLRDLAYALNNGSSCFSVAYDAATATMVLKTGEHYQATGKEMEPVSETPGFALPCVQNLTIDGKTITDLTIYSIDGYNYFRLRDLGPLLNFDVDYDSASRTILVISMGQSSSRPEPPKAESDALRYSQYSGNGIKADVLTVNPKDPGVQIKATMVNNTLGARANFADIVKNSGAAAVITSNFMTGDKEGNYPVGHVMSDGELLYIGSGYSTLGLTANGDVRVGRPSICVRMRPTSRSYDMWKAIGMNLKDAEQAANFSVLYTPSYGTSFNIMDSGSVTVVSGGKVSAYYSVSAGDVVDIPADGYVLWLSNTYMREFVWDFQAPRVGEGVKLEYILNGEDSEGFKLDGVTQIIAGAPRLLKDGQDDFTQEAQFSGDRFTDTYSSSRTAVGVTAKGELVFLSTGGATIPQLRAAMRELGCVDAFNLDGGASTGFYYNGKTYRTPSRQLATTVQIFVN